MTQEVKIITGICIATLIILFGGVFFLSNTQGASPADSVVDEKILLGNSRHIQGEKNAEVTLVEFADFQCPACGAAYPQIKKLLDQYQGKITFMYRHFPLDQHKNARIAAKASEAAAGQGKFWEMYSALYQNQNEWSYSEDPTVLFKKYAVSFGLNEDTFVKAVAGDQFDKTIQNDYSDGVSLGVNSTPTFFLNGKKLTLRSYADLSSVVEEELKK